MRVGYFPPLQREREVLALVVTGLLSKQMQRNWGPPNLPSKSSLGSHAKDAGRIGSRASADGEKVEHSFSKGGVDLYQRVIADPANSGVSVSTNPGYTNSKFKPAHHKQ